MIKFKEFILGKFSILISYASHVKYCIGFGLSFTSKGFLIVERIDEVLK